MSEDSELKPAAGPSLAEHLLSFKPELVRFARRLLVLWPRLSGTAPEDLVQDLFIKLLAGDEDNGTALTLTQLRTCLRNLAIDLDRHERSLARRADGLAAEVNGLTARTPLDEQIDRETEAERAEVVANCLAAVTEALAELVDGQPPRKNGVDGFAVLAFDVRHCLAARVGDAIAADGGGVARRVEQWLPYRREWLSRTFRRGLASLGALWDRASGELEPAPHSIPGWRLIMLLNETRTEEPVVTADAWYKWIDRARERAKTALGQERWSRTLGAVVEGNAGGER